MFTLRKLPLWILFLGICMSCQKKDPAGGFTYLIPWPERSKDGLSTIYVLQPVQIQGLFSSAQMKGNSGSVYYESSLDKEGLTGAPARPKLSLIENVYHPLDVPSGLVVSSYAHLEHLQKMEVEHGLDTGGNWPRVVNVGMVMLDDKGEKEANNARYFYEQDIITIAPYKKTGVPMAINGGVLAHEYFHSVFERLFVKAYRLQNGEPPQQAQGVKFYNEIILRSWNEGLADFYAYLYLQTPDIFGNSIDELTQPLRKLNRPFERLSTTKELKQSLLYQMQGPTCAMGFCVAYQEGTKISRFLYTIWNRLDTDDLRWEFARDLLMGLRNAAELDFTSSGTKEMDLRELIPFIASEKWVNKSKSCENLFLLVGETEILNQYSECNRTTPEVP